MNAAVEAEDYHLAAQLRDEIQADPGEVLRARLGQALDREDFAAAAKIRDELLELEPPPPAASSTGSPYSSEETRGVLVTVSSFYVMDRSIPAQSQFFFAYNVTVKNNSDRTVQLRSRHWVITDGSGHVEEVRGPGVIGEQPILPPGREFQYQSACPLRTPAGTMEGEFQMYVLDEEEGVWGEEFNAVVGRFTFDTMVHGVL